MVPEETERREATIEGLRALAAQKVREEVWEWVNGGTESELTLQRNRWALEKILLRLRVIHGLKTADTNVSILGQALKTPIIVAPFANMHRVHPEGELGIGRGSEASGAMMFLGPVSAYTVKQVVEGTRAPVVWNGDPMKDREKLAALIQQAEKAGCCAIGLCADDFAGVKVKDRLRALGNASLTFEELRRLRQETTLPFVLKGIMTVEDALQAVDAGVSAIVVSNHGGRVLDGCQASVEVLPEIVRCVAEKAEVLVDGGFRTGADVLKALALGAKGVLVGRPICWGLGAAGAEGVARVLHLMTDELARAMILTNVADVKRVPADTVVTT